MTNKKPMLIILAGGTGAGKDPFISKIKKNQLLSDNKVYHIATNDYVTIRVKEESRVGEIVLGFEKASAGERVTFISGLNSRQKKELNENVQVQIKIENDWTRPESVNFQALKQKIKNELNEQNSNKIIIVEGINALQFEELREMADLKLFIQNEDDLRLIRKITRSPYYQKIINGTSDDRRNFGGTHASFPFAFQSWTDGVKPGEKTNILPTKQYADLIVSSDDWKELNQGVEKVVSIIDLYFRNEEEFRRQITREKKERIEGEISELKRQLREKEVELSQLATDTNYQQQAPNK